MSGRIFVLHIMKTAGTSLRLMLSKTLGPDRVFPNHSDLRIYPRRWYPPNEEMAAKVASPPRSVIDCFIGHYTYAFVANLPVRMEAVTFLRDPIARTVSMLKHHRRFLDEPDTPLEAILDNTEFVDLMIKNYMTKVFSIENPLQGVNTRYTISEGELARAVENLSKMSFVGFVDNFYVDFAKLTIWLSVRRGFRLGPFPAEEHLDQTEPDLELSEELIARIRGLVAYDIILYEEARRIFA